MTTDDSLEHGGSSQLSLSGTRSPTDAHDNVGPGRAHVSPTGDGNRADGPPGRGDTVLSLGRARTRAHTCQNTVKIRVNYRGEAEALRGASGGRVTLWGGEKTENCSTHRRKGAGTDSRRTHSNANGARGRCARVPVKFCPRVRRPRGPTTRSWKQRAAESAAYLRRAMALLGRSPHTHTRGTDVGAGAGRLHARNPSTQETNMPVQNRRLLASRGHRNLSSGHP